MGPDDTTGRTVHQRFQSRGTDCRFRRCREQFSESVRAELDLLRIGGSDSPFPVQQCLLHDSEDQDLDARPRIAGNMLKRRISSSFLTSFNLYKLHRVQISESESLYPFQKRCLNHVSKSQRQLPLLRDVFRMYAAMTRGTTIKDLCLRFNPSNLRIDERKLVQFGILEGIINRIHKYPVYVGDNEELQVSLSGNSSLDEICCSIGVNTQQLEDQFDRDSNVVVLWK